METIALTDPGGGCTPLASPQDATASHPIPRRGILGGHGGMTVLSQYSS